MAGVGEQRGDANARHPSESSLLSGKAKFAQKILACGRKAKIFGRKFNDPSPSPRRRPGPSDFLAISSR
jgi:hypothetical protein